MAIVQLRPQTRTMKNSFSSKLSAVALPVKCSVLIALCVAFVCALPTRATAALIYYSVNTTSGDNWNGFFDIANVNVPVLNIDPTSISGPGGATINPTDLFQDYGNSVVTWIDAVGNGGYISFQSPTLFTEVDGGTWASVVAGYSYGLVNAKFLENSGATLYSGSGGTVTFGTSSVPEPGTWAAAAMLVGTAGFMRWRKRAKVA